ncbi:MAG: TIGR04282 family arsenosugar biosynthesis glycosyltransferase [Alphaproteobacteria bacterium]|nr:TIGR04282 family arsenosugar biosynthesis glycosyltransferase [Alphaproteobacteria bacterium]
MRPAWRRQLVLMVKAPEAGRVKTRLARGIGTVAALRFYRSATTAMSHRVSRDRRWTTCLAIAPERALAHPAWPARLKRRGQGRGDLGQRMQRVVDELPPGPVVIVGSDIPGITPSLIARAFRELGRADVVVGPAPDGGYWLIGFKRLPGKPRIFDNVRWSHAETLADTLRNASHLRIATIDVLDDVDEAEDLPPVAGWSGRIVLPPAISNPICNSASYLRVTDKTGRT